MGKKNKNNKEGGSGDAPKENKPPNDKKGGGSSGGGGGGGSGNQPGNSGNQQKKDSKPQQAGQQGNEGGRGPQQGGGGGKQQGGKGPQQGGGGQQQGGGGGQQQVGWGQQQGGRGGPQQGGGGGQQQGGRGGPQQGGGGGQQQGVWGQQQGGRGGPQQGGGSSQQQGAWGQQQGGRGPQQGGGGGQQQGSWGQQQGGRGPQQGGGGGQQQGAGGGQQQGGGGGQQQGGRGPQQGAGGGQQQGSWGQQQGGRGGPQQGGGGGQQKGAWGQQQGGRGGPQQGGGGGQQQGGRGGPQQGGDSGQQQGAWGQQGSGGSGQQYGVRGPQQGGGGGQQYGGRGPQQGSGGGGGGGGFQQYGGRGPQQGGSGGQQYGGRGPQQGGGGGGRGGSQQRYGDGGNRGGQGGGRDYGNRQGGQGGDGGQYQSSQPQPAGKVVRVPPPPKTTVVRGTKGKPFELETNYVMMNLEKMPDFAYHYDVKIDPDRPKKFLRTAFYNFVKKEFPGYELAYDGRANAYSPVILPTDKLNSEITVEVEENKTRKIPFKVTLKSTEDAEIDLRTLKNGTYHTERIFDKPMRALQCIEVVLSTPCHEIGTRAGRSYYVPPDADKKIDLTEGFELWLGLYQAAMLCDQPLLNVDVSHKSFPSQINLVEFYEKLYYPSPNALEELLKGLRVRYTPPQNLNKGVKEFKFNKVMNSSARQMFKTENGQQISVADYFKSKGHTLKKPNLPCLHVGSTVKNIYIPLEFLEVPSGQAVVRKDSEAQVRRMIQHAATSTDVRKEKIYKLLESFKYYVHPTVERFGISIDRSFITVNARLLAAPSIEYSQRNIVHINRPGEWRNNGLFYKCDNKKIHNWAIINVSGRREINAMFLTTNFIPKIANEAKRLGMSLAEKCSKIKEIDSKGRNSPSIMQDLKELKANNISIVFVILHFGADAYGIVKQEAELSIGILTQCIKSETVLTKRGPIDGMTIGNILLKVNAKLNGTNHKISPANEISLQRSKIMFVGADVSHPSPMQTELPSIVGVVASHDLFGTQYNMQYRFQASKLETIEDMQMIMTQHLTVFKKFTGSLPDHVIYYRDGVSDGQFPLVKQIEVTAMRAACKAMKCNAKFTVIIVVKRHHTRFFPKMCDGEGKYNNVKAGTVVDQTICHPNEIQFFMVSHKAIQGTSKPTRYNVIIDDANINIDDLQALTYNLCHLFPRCNRSVSLPTPAYLAHLVGTRGRAYIGSSKLDLNNLKREYSKREVSKDIMNLNPMYFV